MFNPKQRINDLKTVFSAQTTEFLEYFYQSSKSVVSTSLRF